jgi:hypothetical protein
MRKSFSAIAIELFPFFPPRVLLLQNELNEKFKMSAQIKRTAAQNCHTSYEEVPVWPQVSLVHIVL